MVLTGSPKKQQTTTCFDHKQKYCAANNFSVISFRNRGNGEKLISESGVSGSRADGNSQYRKYPIFLPSWGEASGVSEGPSKRIQLYIRESNTFAGRIVTD